MRYCELVLLFLKTAYDSGKSSTMVHFAMIHDLFSTAKAASTYSSGLSVSVIILES
jgi:hypothetical protein